MSHYQLILCKVALLISSPPCQSTLKSGCTMLVGWLHVRVLYVHECSSSLLYGILLRGHKLIIAVTQQSLQNLHLLSNPSGFLSSFPLSPCQCGFTSNRSAISDWLSFTHDCHTALDNGDEICSIYLT